MGRRVIEIVNGVARHPMYRMREPINFVLCESEQLALIGPNGAGKTMLVNTILGRYPLLLNEVHYDFGVADHRMVFENIQYIAFRDSYGDYDANYYYQQRWHSQDVKLSPTVREALGVDGVEVNDVSCLFEQLGIDVLFEKQLVMLSSGELRCLQIAKALLRNPQVLIMDNPFIGLDADMREQLHSVLQMLIRDKHLQLILVLSREEELPNFVTHVVRVEDMICGGKIAVKPTVCKRVENISEKKTHLKASVVNDGEPVVSLRNVTLRYGNRTLFRELTWRVCRGEHWALLGHNGSGKSALLGMICADNPQSYACDISIFGRRRGTGESIWDIKKRIGYVSPEMHRAYLKDLPAVEIVASGLHDSVGLYCRPRSEQMEVCKKWMRVFGIEELADRTFLKLSSGEQRLVLLARAFVKDPELLILDEPFHGLDSVRREMVRDIIDDFCLSPNKTLIMVTHYIEELPVCVTHFKRLS